MHVIRHAFEGDDGQRLCRDLINIGITLDTALMRVSWCFEPSQPHIVISVLTVMREMPSFEHDLVVPVPCPWLNARVTATVET